MELGIIVFIVYVVVSIFNARKKKAGDDKPKEQFDRVRENIQRAKDEWIAQNEAQAAQARSEEGGQDVRAPQVPPQMPPQNQARTQRQQPAAANRRQVAARPAGQPPAASQGPTTGQTLPLETAQRRTAARPAGQPPAASQGKTTGQALTLETAQRKTAAGQQSRRTRQSGSGRAAVAEPPQEVAAVQSIPAPVTNAGVIGVPLPGWPGYGYTAEETRARFRVLVDATSVASKDPAKRRMATTGLAEGMIWSQILGPPKSRQLAYGRPGARRRVGVGD